MSEIDFTATDQGVPADLISFLKAIPDGRYSCGVRYRQWFLLLVAVLGILSGSRAHVIWRHSPNGTERL